jgi:hypothetical protein
VKVTLVTTWRGKRLHIAGYRHFTLCGWCAEHVVWPQYELTEEEPTVAGLTGICQQCRRKAEGK